MYFLEIISMHFLCKIYYLAQAAKMLVSHVQLFVIPWTVARQAPLSMEFPRQEYWSRLPFPSPGDLPHSGMEPESPTLQGDSLLSEPPEKPVMSTPT